MAKKKSVNLKNDIYLDSSGVMHNRVPLSELLNNKITRTKLFDNSPGAGNKGMLSAPDSSYTINDSFANYDFLVIIFASRVWGWCKKEEVIFNRNQFGSSSVSTGGLYSVVMPIYWSNEIATMQYYFTNNNTITIGYNSHYTNDNHLYINTIYGYKILSD